MASKKSTKKHNTVLHTLSDKLIADVVRGLPDAEREPLEAICLGEALVSGEIVVEDSADLPPDIRAANLRRIKKIPDPQVRAELLRPPVIS